MKTLEVYLNAFYGYGCCGVGHESENTIEIDIDDMSASKIENLLQTHSPLNQSVLAKLKKQGHTYLKPIIKQIDEQWDKMNAHYWIEDSKRNSDSKESLENYIVNTIANGEWLPSKPDDGERTFDDMLEEFIQWLDNQPIEEQLSAYGLDLSYYENNKEYEILAVKTK